jgi:hypothetical protein
MSATSRLRLGLPVRLLVGRPQMPKTARPAAASLSPSRGSYRGRRDVRVHRPIAPGRSSLPVPRESIHPSVPTLRNLAAFPLRGLRSCRSQRGDNAGSIARHTVSKWRSRRARNFFVLQRLGLLAYTLILCLGVLAYLTGRLDRSVRAGHSADPSWRPRLDVYAEHESEFLEPGLLTIRSRRIRSRVTRTATIRSGCANPSSTGFRRS